MKRFAEYFRKVATLMVATLMTAPDGALTMLAALSLHQRMDLEDVGTLRGTAGT
jgi:hypothetical protein